MKAKSKLLIHKTNNFLNSTKAIIVVLILLFAYFAYGNFQFQKQNNTLINNTSLTVSKLKRVLCEKIPDKDCNLTQAVLQLKTDNANQTILLCKLFLASRSDLSNDDTAQVEAICNEQILKLSGPTQQSSGSASSASGTSRPTSSPSSSNGSSGASSSPNTAPNNPQAQPTPLLQVTPNLPKPCIEVSPVFGIC